MRCSSRSNPALPSAATLQVHAVQKLPQKGTMRCAQFSLLPVTATKTAPKRHLGSLPLEPECLSPMQTAAHWDRLVGAERLIFLSVLVSWLIVNKFFDLTSCEELC